MIAHHGCGATWMQGGNGVGHCCGCHRTFHSEEAFEAHRRPGGICLDPATLLHKDGMPRWEIRIDSVGCEVWRSTRKVSDESRAKLRAITAAEKAKRAAAA